MENCASITFQKVVSGVKTLQNILTKQLSVYLLVKFLSSLEPESREKRIKQLVEWCGRARVSETTNKCMFNCCTINVCKQHNSTSHASVLIACAKSWLKGMCLENIYLNHIARYEAIKKILKHMLRLPASLAHYFTTPFGILLYVHIMLAVLSHTQHTKLRHYFYKTFA